MPAKSKLTLRERFFLKVTKTDGGCWDWNGVITSGYGRMNIGGRKTEYTHRLSYLWFRGPVPDGLWVLHHCDNRKCVNPDHLWLGTHADNMKDMRRKNRSRKKGEDNPQAKLTEDQVRYVLTNYRPYIVTIKQLAKKLKVSAGCLRSIVTGPNWNHLKEKSSDED